jgi:O-antigen/teichoic acid export membrane protein
VFSQINFRADAIMLSVLNLPAIFGYSNTRAVAEYGLGYKVFEVALVFPTFFMNALYPVLVRKTYEGPKVLLNVFLKSLGTLFACGLLFGLIGYVFAPFAINVLGGSAFVHSVTVLRILMIGLFVFFLTQPLSWLIVSLGKQKYLPVIYLISAIFNVIANFIVIPIFSFFGSAVVTILSEILILILLLCFVYRAWFLKFNAQK